MFCPCAPLGHQVERVAVDRDETLEDARHARTHRLHQLVADQVRVQSGNGAGGVVDVATVVHVAVDADVTVHIAHEHVDAVRWLPLEDRRGRPGLDGRVVEREDDPVVAVARVNTTPSGPGFTGRSRRPRRVRRSATRTSSSTVRCVA